MLFQGQKYTCSTYISLHHCIIWIWFDYHYSKTNFVIACYSFFAIKKISVVNTITTVIPSNKYIVFTKNQNLFIYSLHKFALYSTIFIAEMQNCNAKFWQCNMIWVWLEDCLWHINELKNWLGCNFLIMSATAPICTAPSPYQCSCSLVNITQNSIYKK